MCSEGHDIHSHFQSLSFGTTVKSSSRPDGSLAHVGSPVDPISSATTEGRNHGGALVPLDLHSPGDSLPV